MAKRSGAAHVVTIVKRVGEREYRTHLLRRSYRDGDKVRNETLANLSALGEEKVAMIRLALQGKKLVNFDEAVTVTNSLPHGHVAALLAMARKLDLERLIDRTPSRKRRLALALVVQRVLSAGSKLASSRYFAHSTLGEELGVIGADQDDLYAAMDYLLERQGAIERRLAGRHLGHATLVLYDLSSSYFEGRTCPLGMRGYSRDERRGSLQIVYGLLCDREGRPIAVEVFQGNTLDHQTVRTQIEKLKERFGLRRVVFVSDRGMVTTANLDLLREQHIDWITALKAPQVKALRAEGALPLSLFDERNMAEIEREEYPGERLVVCRNPLLAQERSRKREDLLRATERKLRPIQERVERGTLRGKAKIGLKVGEVYNTYKMSKHLELRIEDDRFTFMRKDEQIAAEAALDGIYILRTSVSAQAIDTPDVVRAYKQLAKVERAFRTMKSDDLQIRPIHHRLEDRVRAHVFLCMLAYYVEWHLRKVWAPLLFIDDDPQIADDPVTQGTRSACALTKARTRRTSSGEIVHSYRTLLDHMASQARSTMTIAGSPPCHKVTQPTPLQARALELVRALQTAA
ncbi:MAG: IS1634 family transposase [Vulcanimicrobiaceae bacterium]